MSRNWFCVAASFALTVLTGLPSFGEGVGEYVISDRRPADLQASATVSEHEESEIQARAVTFRSCEDACETNVCDPCLSDAPLELMSRTENGFKIGGWFQAGYNTKSDGRFNNVPNALNLHQAYLYAEKAADGQNGLDWGFRMDLMYGVDGADSQAFGSNPGNWDFRNGFDHGIYSWALPQAYAELAAGDLSVKLGHFYTLIGYEVVTAPDNFFFTHAFTMYNSEPFTHTGALASYAASDNVTLYGGWTLGWDTGFDAYRGGSNFLGGFGYTITDDIAMTYITCFGDLGWRGEGYNHSLVFDVTLTDKLQYVFQTDFVSTNTDVAYNDVGINQYLFYTLNDRWKLGGRAEWWKRDGESLWEVTAGVNWLPHPNLVVRPEVKYNEGDALLSLGLPENSVIFAIDAVLTF